MSEQKNTVVIIAGPTAVGKTELAIQIAQYFQTQIISADSRQCYQELNIGVAKPTPAQLSAIPHYFINSHSIQQTVQAATFENYALNVVAGICQQSHVAVLTGGTGLYIQAFCEGLDEIPFVPEEIRRQVADRYASEGISFLQNELRQKDALFWKQAEQHNPQRLMRALEVLYATGYSILSYRKKAIVKRPFNIIKIGLELPREMLYERINNRVNDMMQQGLLDEVKSLQAYQNLNALQTVGYKELFDYINNKTSLEQAIHLIKQNTRHYAKRQLTWFKKDTQIKWFAPDEFDAVMKFIKR